MNLTLIFIAHDLSVVKHISDDEAVSGSTGLTVGELPHEHPKDPICKRMVNSTFVTCDASSQLAGRCQQQPSFTVF